MTTKWLHGRHVTCSTCRAKWMAAKQRCFVRDEKLVEAQKWLYASATSMRGGALQTRLAAYLCKMVLLTSYHPPHNAQTPHRELRGSLGHTPQCSPRPMPLRGLYSLCPSVLDCPLRCRQKQWNKWWNPHLRTQSTVHSML